MAEVHEFPIYSEGDVISARMETRKLARSLGMSTADQARVSLAASSLAHVMELGRGSKGKITLSSLNGARQGIQIVCTSAHRSTDTSMVNLLKSGEWNMMVDELTVAVLPNQDLLVVAIKWVA